MGLREDLSRRIDKKRKEINDLDLKIRAAESYIQALEDTLRMLPPEEDARLEVLPGAQTRPEEALRVGSKPARAFEILRKEGRAMHINKMLEAMGEKTGLEDRTALASSLGAYVRDAKIFTRPAPNTFGLIDFNGISVPDAVSEPEPPSGFGEDAPEESPGITDDDVPF